MNKFIKRAIIVILTELIIILAVNILVNRKESEDRPYIVEIKRAAAMIKETGKIPDTGDFIYITEIKKYDAADTDSNDYRIEQIEGEIYRFNYVKEDKDNIILFFNIGFAGFLAVTAGILIYFYSTLVRPFNKMQYLTKELAKGNLSTPIKAEKSRYYGDFIWGMDMLREKLEQDKVREFELLKEKKTIILSMTHDIKTPLASMDLYLRALSENLYEEDRKEVILEGIRKNLKEINNYINGIAKASKEDAVDIVVNNSEFYIKNVFDAVLKYYKEKMELLHIDFYIQKQENCLVYGDEDRIVEVMQNLIENAVKYGNGGYIGIKSEDEEDCRLITVCNSGEGPGDDEMLHIFDSFYRGSNSSNVNGSGMGLYICRKILHMMDGEIFAENKDGCFNVTVVLKKV
ncbi:sensor histidine kinase [Eshraghiella crossota]|uniref:HAMP domain-containing sensor histidine kinase n=1 Tax=Eshraghiella crossota TaxID=45851 RepID=UPI003F7D164E